MRVCVCVSMYLSYIFIYMCIFFEISVNQSINLYRSIDMCVGVNSPSSPELLFDTNVNPDVFRIRFISIYIDLYLQIYIYTYNYTYIYI